MNHWKRWRRNGRVDRAAQPIKAAAQDLAGSYTDMLPVNVLPASVLFSLGQGRRQILCPYSVPKTKNGALLHKAWCKLPGLFKLSTSAVKTDVSLRTPCALCRLVIFCFWKHWLLLTGVYQGISEGQAGNLYHHGELHSCKTVNNSSSGSNLCVSLNSWSVSATYSKLWLLSWW